MQVSHPQAAIEDFQMGIFSNDPVEYNAAINLYVEPQASYSSSLISTHGASKIKNILALEKLFVREIRVDKRKSSGISGGGGGQWDEDSQVYFVPTLTTYGLPFALPIIDLSFTFPTSLTLHLNVNEDPDLEVVNEDEDRIISRSTSLSKSRSRAGSSSSGEREKRYVVTKWEERGPVDSIIRFGGKTVQKLHNSWIRPMTTLLILLVAGTKHFIHTHPLSDGILNFIFAAIVTFVTEARDIVLAELSSKHPRMVYHTEDYTKPIKRTAHSAQSSISSAVNVKPHISARPQSPASSVRSRTSTRAPFPAPSAGSPTTSASTVFATGAVSKKSPEQDHPSFAEVVKEGDTVCVSAEKKKQKKKKEDEPRKLGQPIQATNVDEGHPSYAQVVLEGDEEHDHHHYDHHRHHKDHPTESHPGAEHTQGEIDTHAAPADQHHHEHASYAEVAADVGVEGHHH